jgi:hypothetical protein
LIGFISSSYMRPTYVVESERLNGI